MCSCFYFIQAASVAYGRYIERTQPLMVILAGDTEYISTSQLRELGRNRADTAGRSGDNNFISLCSADRVHRCIRSRAGDKQCACNFPRDIRRFYDEIRFRNDDVISLRGLRGYACNR